MRKSILLTIFLLSSLAILAQTGADPIISEYVEGWSNNKSLELYNPTDTAIDLSAYRITRYSNGNVPPVKDQWWVKLSGMLLPYKTKVFVIDKRDPQGSGNEAPVWDELQARADTFVCPIYNDSYALYFNGDDAVALEKLDGSQVDIFGKIGQRPVNASGGTSQPTGGWTDTDPYHTGVGTILTGDHTLVRKASITEGVSTIVDKFNTLAEWDSLPANTFTGLGWHECTASPDSNLKPSFEASSYAFTISINDPSGTSVGTITADDPNGDMLSFYITEGNSYDPFSIIRETGEIRVAKTEELYWRDYTLTVDVTDGTSPVSMQVSVTVEGGYTGIRDRSHELEIFPNPVMNGSLKIEAAEDIKGIEMFNLVGKRVFHEYNEGGSTRMNVSMGDIGAGLYMLRVNFRDNTNTVRKVMVK